MVIVRPINLNVSCKLHSYSLQRTQSPPRPCLHKRIRNMHPHNYYDLKGKDIDIQFSFLNRGIILWIELPWPENPANTCARHTETLDSCFDLIRSHQPCIPWSPPLEIKPATTDCRAETLLLSQQFISHTSDAKLTSYGSIFSDGDNHIHCWWDLVRSKHLSSVTVCRCSLDFLAIVIQFTT